MPFVKGGPNPGFKKGENQFTHPRPPKPKVVKTRLEKEISEAVALAKSQLLGIIKDPKEAAAVKIRAMRDLREIHSEAAPCEQKFVLYAPRVFEDSAIWQDQAALWGCL